MKQFTFRVYSVNATDRSHSLTFYAVGPNQLLKEMLLKYPILQCLLHIDTVTSNLLSPLSHGRGICVQSLCLKYGVSHFRQKTSADQLSSTEYRDQIIATYLFC
jgi:hypothetical protein